MKKLLLKIYRNVVCESNPVTDVTTGKKEIATYTEICGIVTKINYKPL